MSGNNFLMANEDEPLHDKTNGMTQSDLPTLHRVGCDLECPDLIQTVFSSHLMQIYVTLSMDIGCISAIGQTVLCVACKAWSTHDIGIMTPSALSLPSSALSHFWFRINKF